MACRKMKWKKWDKWLRIYAMGLVALAPERQGDLGYTFLLPANHDAAAEQRETDDCSRPTEGETAAQQTHATAHHAILTFRAEVRSCSGSEDFGDQGWKIKKLLGVREAPTGWILNGEDVALGGGFEGCVDLNKRSLWRWLVSWKSRMLGEPLFPKSPADAEAARWLPGVRSSRMSTADVSQQALITNPEAIVARMRVAGKATKLSTAALTSLPARPRCRRLAGTVASLEFRSAEKGRKKRRPLGSPQAMAEVMALDVAYDGAEIRIATLPFGRHRRCTQAPRCVVLTPHKDTGRIEILLANLTPLQNCVYREQADVDLHFPMYHRVVQASQELPPVLTRSAAEIKLRDVSASKVLPEILHQVSDHAKKGGLSRPFCTAGLTGDLDGAPLVLGAEELAPAPPATQQCAQRASSTRNQSPRCLEVEENP